MLTAMVVFCYLNLFKVTSCKYPRCVIIEINSHSHIYVQTNRDTDTLKPDAPSPQLYVRFDWISCVYSVTFKAANSFEGLSLHAKGCKAGSVGYTQEQTEAMQPSTVWR